MNTKIDSIGQISGVLNAKQAVLKGTTSTAGQLSGQVFFGKSTGTKDYDLLINKPLIESVELQGDKTFEELGLSPIDADDIINILT